MFGVVEIETTKFVDGDHVKMCKLSVEIRDLQETGQRAAFHHSFFSLSLNNRDENSFHSSANEKC